MAVPEQSGGDPAPLPVGKRRNPGRGRRWAHSPVRTARIKRGFFLGRLAKWAGRRVLTGACARARAHGLGVWWQSGNRDSTLGGSCPNSQKVLEASLRSGFSKLEHSEWIRTREHSTHFFGSGERHSSTSLLARSLPRSRSLSRSLARALNLSLSGGAGGREPQNPVRSLGEGIFGIGVIFPITNVNVTEVA